MTSLPIIHHLNCGTLRLPGAPMICHVLLLEYEDGLVLVDAGFGLDDISEPKRRIGPVRRLIRPLLDPNETALSQIERRGFSRDDVRDILLTHLDVDHVGGVSDFPNARLHISAVEADAAIHHPTGFERKRYNRRQWGRKAQFVEHPAGAEEWMGISGAADLSDWAPGVVMTPLPGHTRGHVGYAIRRKSGWLLHAGDAFYFAASLENRAIPIAAAIQERLVAFDYPTYRRTQNLLGRLQSSNAHNVTVICSHDPDLLP